MHVPKILQELSGLGGGQGCEGSPKPPDFGGPSQSLRLSHNVVSWWGKHPQPPLRTLVHLAKRPPAPGNSGAPDGDSIPRTAWTSPRKVDRGLTVIGTVRT